MFAAKFAARPAAPVLGTAACAVSTGAADRTLPGMPGSRGSCVVRLIDRRTGLTHRVNGTPLVIFTRRPDEAVTELLEGRDRAIWQAQVDPLEP